MNFEGKIVWKERNEEAELRRFGFLEKYARNRIFCASYLRFIVHPVRDGWKSFYCSEYFFPCLDNCLKFNKKKEKQEKWKFEVKLKTENCEIFQIGIN